MVEKRGVWWRWWDQVRIGVAVFQGAQANAVTAVSVWCSSIQESRLMRL
jgi:hypothetical protein